jgi:hypothetical protein
LELQEMSFIKGQGQQITSKPLINISKNCINFGGKFSRIRTGILLVLSVYYTNLAFLDIVVGTSFINNNIMVCLLSLTVSV